MSAEVAIRPPLSVCHPQELVRVYVWEWPVRLSHWLTAYAVLFLALTGFYIGRPLMTMSGPAGAHFVMGWAKTAHFYLALVFTLAVIIRIVWMFTGNEFSRWDKFVPVRRSRRRGLIEALRYYLFQLRQPPGYVGHNPLAGFTYIFVFLLFLLMITTGLGIYATSAHVASPFRMFRFFVGFYGGLQTSRWLHHIGMWLILGFAVHHVYSSVLMSQVEARGTVESMASGYKFVPCEDLTIKEYRFADPKDFEA